MPNEQEPRREFPMRRRIRTTRGGGNGLPDRRPDHFYFQVHFQPVPGARKTHFTAIRPKLTERLHEMIRRGQLLMSGGYPSSIGGMWLLKVKNRGEAERLVADHPAVACNLIKYRLIELQDPMGAAIRQENAQPSVEQIEP